MAAKSCYIYVIHPLYIIAKTVIHPYLHILHGGHRCAGDRLDWRPLADHAYIFSGGDRRARRGVAVNV